jgi:histidinol phosphatase-like enzyme (inositol monophosphatase family)
VDPLAVRLEFALQVARRASEFILSYWRSTELTVEHKTDLSPVTIADRGAEQLIREAVQRQFPDDAVLGEEFGETAGRSGFRWILDPVDGTKSFVAGVPLFGTLIGVEQQGDPVIGVCRLPALDEVVWARRGGGAWLQRGVQPPQRARVSNVERLADALFCFTSAGGWDAAGRFEAFAEFCRRCRLTRGWGDCYGHILVATGRADLAIDPVMNLWDAAALLPILEEAGGCFSDLSGRATVAGGSGVSTNRALQPAILDILQGRAGSTSMRGRD